MDCTTWIFWLSGFQVGLANGEAPAGAQRAGGESSPRKTSVFAKKEMHSFVTLQGAEEQLSTHVGDLSLLPI